MATDERPGFSTKMQEPSDELTVRAHQDLLAAHALDWTPRLGGMKGTAMTALLGEGAVVSARVFKCSSGPNGVCVGLQLTTSDGSPAQTFGYESSIYEDFGVGSDNTMIAQVNVRSDFSQVWAFQFQTNGPNVQVSPWLGFTATPTPGTEHMGVFTYDTMGQLKQIAGRLGAVSTRGDKVRGIVQIEIGCVNHAFNFRDVYEEYDGEKKAMGAEFVTAAAARWSLAWGSKLSTPQKREAAISALNPNERTKLSLFLNAIRNDGSDPKDAAAAAGDTDYKQLHGSLYQIRLSQGNRVTFDVDRSSHVVTVQQIGGHT